MARMPDEVVVNVRLNLSGDREQLIDIGTRAVLGVDFRGELPPFYGDEARRIATAVMDVLLAPVAPTRTPEQQALAQAIFDIDNYGDEGRVMLCEGSGYPTHHYALRGYGVCKMCGQRVRVYVDDCAMVHERVDVPAPVAPTPTEPNHAVDGTSGHSVARDYPSTSVAPTPEPPE